MSRSHLRTSETGPRPRTVTRRAALRLLMGAGLCSALAPSAAEAATTQERLDAAQLSYEEAQEELERIGEEYSEIAAQVSETQVRIGDVTSQIEETQGVIDDTQDQIDDKQDQISDAEDEIDATQQEIEDKQEKIGRRMSASYKSGTTGTLDLLLSSTTFDQLTSNIYYLDKVSQAEREMIDDVKELKAALEEQRAALEEQKASLEEQMEELEAQKASLEDQRSELEELEEQQSAELEEARAKQAESQELVNSLSEEVQELMAQRDAELLAAQQAAEEARRREEEAASQGSSGSSGSTVVNGSGSLSAVVSACYSTPSPGSGLCAAWVTDVFQNAGIGSFWGNADDMYYSWCGTSTSAIQPGMIIAVNSSPTSAAGRIYGHIGIYIGNNTVMHNIGYVASYSLSQWISIYSALCTPLCGWLGGIVLS